MLEPFESLLAAAKAASEANQIIEMANTIREDTDELRVAVKAMLHDLESCRREKLMLSKDLMQAYAEIAALKERLGDA